MWWVVWFWSAVSWGFHGVVLGPGWAAVMAAESERSCIELRDSIPIRPGIHALMCLPAGTLPQGEIAEGR